MDLPKPPDDIDLKNIIDKLANFVARNGRDFENMTKNKQKENPKFSFLFGGEYFNYYQFKVTTEQAIIKQQAKLGMPPVASGSWSSVPGANNQSSVPPIANLSVPLLGTEGAPAVPVQHSRLPQLQEQLQKQQLEATEQTKVSEQNLSAQYQSMMSQQQVQVLEAIEKKQLNDLNNLFGRCQIIQEDFNQILQPLIDSCTKDAISQGKNWIFINNTSPLHSELIATYFKHRITSKSASFETRLHLIYLINDILHHCLRKNVDDLKEALECVVIPIFCVTHVEAVDSQRVKLEKLLKLWRNNNYFSEDVVEKLKSPAETYTIYQSTLMAENNSIVTQINDDIQQRYNALQQQHLQFVAHLNSQITATQNLIQQEQQNVQPMPITSTVQPSLPTGGAPGPGFGPNHYSVPPTFPPSAGPPPGTAPPGAAPPSTAQSAGDPSSRFAQPQQFDYGHGSVPVIQEYNHGHVSTVAPPPTDTTNGPPPPAIQLPDLSKPPPGFPLRPSLPGAMPTEAELTPSAPYFELPAGLMAPLVKLEDSDYRPLDPKDIRLPPPMPPSERLLAAVEAFYTQPTHEHPRDGEGWEKLGLFEFFKAKNNAKKARMEAQRRHRSRSRSPRRSRSRSPRRRRRSRSNSRSKSRSRSKERSDSPLPYRQSSRSRSRTPPRYKRGSPNKSRSLSRSPSISPVPFNMPVVQATMDTKIGSDNKGHQLMKKMGWEGGGLGQNEQGIVDPIDRAEVRDKNSKFKGVGMVNSAGDPFETFRQNRSERFIQRMVTTARARDAAIEKELQHRDPID